VRLESRTDLREFDGRLRVVGVLFLIPILLLTARLWYLQILNGNNYREAALANSIDERPTPPSRGVIADRQGRILAENRPSYDVYVTPLLFGRHPEALSVLRTHLSLSDDEVDRLTRAVDDGVIRDIRLRRDISRDQVAVLETDHAALPGVFVRPVPHRHYPYDDLGVHLLGYMGEVAPEALRTLDEYGYAEGDYVGHGGLEAALEAVLRGQEGRDRFVVDARGRCQTGAIVEMLLGDYQRVDPIAGRDAVLTLDIGLQEVLRDAMRDYETGAIVAIDPRDGSILAMLSKPGYNPNAWTGRLSREELLAAHNDEHTPLYDRAIHSYFPGSTFKIVTAAAALEEGLIGPEDTLHCDGQYTYGNRVFHCNRHHGHGDITLAAALQQSCNVYFYKLGERLGIERLVEYGNLFGFGEYPGANLPNESRGLVPNREWLDEHSPEGFQYGQVLNVSVGQGDTRTSPLQMAMAYAAIANGGVLFYPRLIDRIESAGNTLFEYPSRVRRELPFEREHVDEIRLGLTMAVNAPGGTAYESNLDYMIVAGKTGTAEGSQIDTVSGDDGDVPEAERTSAWFAGFAPAEDPQIVVVVFLEHGGSGGRNAAPVGVEVIDRYFREILGDEFDPSSVVAARSPSQLEGLMRLTRPGRENDSLSISDWAEPYGLGTYPDQPVERLVNRWRDRGGGDRR